MFGWMVWGVYGVEPVGRALGKAMKMASPGARCDFTPGRQSSEPFFWAVVGAVLLVLRPRFFLGLSFSEELYSSEIASSSSSASLVGGEGTALASSSS